MKDTAFWVPAEKRGRFAQAYTQPGALRPYRQTHLEVGDYDREPVFASGGAGLVSTLDDYAAFATMLLAEGRYPADNCSSRKPCASSPRPSWARSPWRMCGTPWTASAMASSCASCAIPAATPALSRMDEYGWDGWLGTYLPTSPMNR